MLQNIVALGLCFLNEDEREEKNKRRGEENRRGEETEKTKHRPEMISEKLWAERRGGIQLDRA